MADSLITEQEIHERWVYWLEVGDRAALRTQERQRMIGGEIDMRWWRGLWR